MYNGKNNACSNENEQYDPPEIRTVCIIEPVCIIGPVFIIGT